MEVLANGTPPENLHDAEVTGPADMGRSSTIAGSDPTDIGYVSLTYGGNHWRHVRVHDVHNCFAGSAQPGLMLEDVTVYNVGWRGTDRAPDGGHGFYIYLQNGADAAAKTIDRCLFVAGFEGGKLFSTNTDTVHHFQLTRCIFHGKSFLVGGTHYGADDILIDDCAFLDTHLILGYTAANGAISVTNSLLARNGDYAFPNGCVVVGGSSGSSPQWQQVTFRGNTLVTGKMDGAPADTAATHNRAVLVYKTPLETIQAWDWDDNTYYCRNPYPFYIDGIGLLNFAQWQQMTGLDANSTFINGEPPEVIVRCYAVPERSAANVAVVNPQGTERVALPPPYTSAVIRRVRDWNNAIEGGELPMTGEIAAPLNWTQGATTAPLPKDSQPRFGVFRLENTVSG